MFEKWFGKKSEYDDEASVEEAWKTHAEAFRKQFAQTIGHVDDQARINAFFNDAEATVFEDYRLSLADMERFMSRLRSHILNDYLLDHSDHYAQLQRDWDAQQHQRAAAENERRQRERALVYDPETAAFGPANGTQDDFHRAASSDHAAPERHDIQPSAARLAEMEAAYANAQHFHRPSSNDAHHDDTDSAPTQEQITQPEQRRDRHDADALDAEAQRRKTEQQPPRRVTSESVVGRGELSRSAKTEEEFFNAMPFGEKVERVRAAHVAMDAETLHRAEGASFRRLWEAVTTRVRGWRFGAAMKRMVAAVSAVGLALQSVPAAAAERVRITEQKKTPVTSARERNAAMESSVTLRPVVAGDTLSDMVLQYLREQHFLDGVSDGAPAARFAQRVIAEEQRRRRGAWTQAGVRSNNPDNIAVGETPTLLTLADGVLLRTWQNDLSAPRQERADVTAVPQPATQTPPATSWDEMMMAPRAVEYAPGTRTVTYEHRVRAIAEMDRQELGRNVRLLTERTLGRDAVYVTPVAGTVIGEIIARSAQPQQTKQMIDRMSAASGVTYDPETTRWNMFCARIVAAGAMERAAVAARQTETTSPSAQEPLVAPQDMSAPEKSSTASRTSEATESVPMKKLSDDILKKREQYMTELYAFVQGLPEFSQLVEENMQLQKLLFTYADRLKEVMKKEDFDALVKNSPYARQWATKSRGPVTQQEIRRITFENIFPVRAVISSFNTKRSADISDDELKNHDRDVAQEAFYKTPDGIAQLRREIRTNIAIVHAVNAEVEKALKASIANH